MKLYEILNEIESLVDQETGEIADFERLSELAIDRDTKIENLALYHKNLTAEANAIREEEKKLAIRRAVIERSVARIGEYMAHLLNGEPFETARCRVSFRRSDSVEIDDADACGTYLIYNDYDDCVDIKRVPKKDAIKKLLATGVEIPGVRIVTKNNMGVK